MTQNEHIAKWMADYGFTAWDVEWNWKSVKFCLCLLVGSCAVTFGLYSWDGISVPMAFNVPMVLASSNSLLVVGSGNHWMNIALFYLLLQTLALGLFTCFEVFSWITTMLGHRWFLSKGAVDI